MAYTYMLRCSDDSLYVGSTWALENRVDQHNAGRIAGWTSQRRPVVLVWVAELDRIDEAHGLERRLKGWSRAKKLALIEGRLNDLPLLARCRSVRRFQSPDGGETGSGG